MSDAPDTVPYGRFVEVNTEKNRALERIKELETAYEKSKKALKVTEGRLDSVTQEKDNEIARIQVDHQADLALAFLPDDESGQEMRGYLRHKYDSVEMEEGEERPAMNEWLNSYRESAGGKRMLGPFEEKAAPAAPGKEKKAADAPPRPAKPDVPGSDPTHSGRTGGDPPPPTDIAPEDLSRMSDAQIKELGGIDAIVKRAFGNA